VTKDRQAAGIIDEATRMIERIVIRSKQTDKESHFETGSPVTTNWEGPNHLPQPSILVLLPGLLHRKHA
jgi:hypothetical protein